MSKLIFRSGAYTGKSISLPAGKVIVLGRNRDVDLPLPDLKLSRRHCQISATPETVFIKDLGSTNGTFLNGERLEEEVELNTFDRIVLGDTEIEFQSLEHGEKLQAVSNDKTPVSMASVEDDDGPLPVPGFMAVSTDAPQVQAFTPSLGLPVPVRGNPPPQIQMQQQIEEDPFEAALLELSLPLPPEPPPLAGNDESARRSKVLFCDLCDSSIPMLDWDLGSAREAKGKVCCKDCLARMDAAAPPPSDLHSPVKMPAVPPQAPSAANAPVAHVPAAASRKPAVPNIDDVLAGLEQEAVVVDTTLKRRGKEVAEADVSKAMNDLERTKQRAGSGAAPLPGRAATPPARPQPAPPPPPKENLFGEEFEEIG